MTRFHSQPLHFSPPSLASLLPRSRRLLPPIHLSHPIKTTNLLPNLNPFSYPLSIPLLQSRPCRAFVGEAEKHGGRQFKGEEMGDGGGIWRDYDDLGEEGEVFKETLKLVECAMFASVAGLAYFLSNSLAIENYFGCFFALPIVISSMRWGLAAGRKTMVATAILLLTLSGPVKASTYLLMHGVVGLAMGSLWRLGTNWATSIILCTIVRAMGAVGYVLLSSFLIRENILALITINIHASLTYILTGIGVNTVPSMYAIYTIFGSLLLLNCGFFVFLLHILYAVFLTKLGMRASLKLPKWMERAI
ncbi:uncharacterized protein [Typha latifolia]|uniref:uncharacterized protein isoform X1 n=2 Tax=Typha latifolia TaxID=4733 RepID=UPI003C30BFED